MTGARRRFTVTVTVPDWGQDHLSTEAVVAYVDGELAAGPLERAARHLAACQECAAQVASQRQTRSTLRTAETPCLPSSLMSALRSIPQHTDLPPAPAGLAVGPDGQLVNVLRPAGVPRSAIRADVVTPSAPAGLPTVDKQAEAPPHRRLRFGTTAAMSGLALGALALGVAGAAAGAPAPGTTDRGVFNGSVVGGNPAGASLRLPVTSATAVDQMRARLDHGVRSYLLGR